jgi:hypothetical protein
MVGRGDPKRVFPMRIFLAAGLLALSLALAAPAYATEKIEPATLDAVTALATKGYAHPETAKVKDVLKSKARNGLGYCGEVTIEDGKGYTVFHAIIADSSGGGASILRLADYPEGDTSRNAIAVRQMMRNFGCTK